MRLITRAINPNIITDRMILMTAILPRYFGARDLSRDTSLIINVLNPKLRKTAKIIVKARAKEYLPRITSPSIRAMLMKNSKPSK